MEAAVAGASVGGDMALIDLHYRPVARPEAPAQRTTGPTTATRLSLADTPTLQAGIVTIRNLGSDGIPCIPSPWPVALIPLNGALYFEWGEGAVWMDLNQIVLVPGGLPLRQRHAVAGDVAYMTVSCPPWLTGDCVVQPIGADLQREAMRLATLMTARNAPSPSVREKALRVILDQVAVMAPPARPSAASERSLALVQRVRELVQETSTPRPLEDLAARVGASPVYLTSLFRQIEGMPIYRYQARLRLARSLRSLGSADDITSVAMELGFANHSHFTTAFRTAFGLTPSAYKASLNPG